ncbi:hypothetical protein BC834DRAFT_442814 [Gloeopeniophorella convolvens]|nr:hypothetical protein BC834DRAFT_442814 [Gloeopeniophorella convolvens]
MIMPIKVFWHPDCLLHDPPYEILSGDKVPYFESPTRLTLVKEELERYPSLFAFELANWTARGLPDVTHKFIRMVHSDGYLDYLKSAYDKWVEDGGSTDAVLPESFPHVNLLRGLDSTQIQALSPIAKAGLYCFDLSCPITKDTYSSVIASAGVAMTAAQELIDVSSSSDAKMIAAVFALCRPPGHHAGTSLCGGYCFVNNVAVAARFLQHANPGHQNPRVAILDIDYHHGNGTQEIFYSDPSVLYASLHAHDDYPYFTGAKTEKGSGEGSGTNFNFPLPRGTGDSVYCDTLVDATDVVRTFDPEYLLVSLGVDTYVDDPISDFRLSHACYSEVGRIIARLEKPTLFLMEGGYHMETIGKNVCAVLRGFTELPGGGIGARRVISTE